MGVVCGPTELMGSTNCKPSAGFEGFEKRLELDFVIDSNNYEASGVKWRGLRALPRAELNKMLAAAQCTIVSELSNEYCDSYVLSESSLFVYPLKMVLKTCGTTQLLMAIPPLLAASFQLLHLKVKRCKYTRGSFMFPSVQLYPHGNFNDEVTYLQSYFGHLGSGGKAYVMGSFPNWHIYIAAAGDNHDHEHHDSHHFNTDLLSSDHDHIIEPTYTVEVCMTELDRAKAHQFFNADGSLSGRDMTKASGIDGIIPLAKICDFSFNPCGYSMNALEGKAHSTIHVTPEDGYSYASFESMGYGPKDMKLQTLLDKVARVFEPGKFSLSVQVSICNGSKLQSKNSQVPIESWGGPVTPLGYVCQGTTRREMPCGSVVVFHTFQAISACEDHETELLLSSPITPLALLENHQHLWPGAELQTDRHRHDSEMPAKVQIHESQLVQNYELPDSTKGQQVHESQLVQNYDLPRDAWEMCSRHGRKILDVFSAVNPVAIGPTLSDMDQFIRSTITTSAKENPFYVMDLGLVLRLWRAWESAMPRVKPFYAVKCNPDTTLLSLLAMAGAGFDVASKVELAAVRHLGVTGDRVIFANPCKLPSHIVDAAKHGVLRTTFDSETELLKLSKYHPTAEVILRIRADDIGARCPLGMKYGAEMEECEHLLGAAKGYGLKVVGVAFHVGSGACHAAAFGEGIAISRRVFDMAVAMGLPPLKLLDVGGGFVSKGRRGVKFGAAAAVINEALEKYFPESMAVEVIAEPGRYFAEEAFTLATHVFGSRMRVKSGIKTADYWVNDGIYGSMNCLLYDHATLSVRAVTTSPLDNHDHGGHEDWNKKLCTAPVYKSTVFGQTCDGLDTIMRDIWLPQLRCGDWLVFPRMGAYTKSAGSSFNGFDLQYIGTAYVYSCEDNNNNSNGKNNDNNDNHNHKLPAGNVYDSDHDTEELSDSGRPFDDLLRLEQQPGFHQTHESKNSYGASIDDPPALITSSFGGSPGGTSSDDEF
ncbi:unnamed protein product [Calypogeia fissa]